MKWPARQLPCLSDGEDCKLRNDMTVQDLQFTYLPYSGMVGLIHTHSSVVLMVEENDSPLNF
jgi:hypothetical protein